MNQNTYKLARTHVKILNRLNLNIFYKSVIFLAIVGVVLYAVFFSTYAPVHDYFHGIRHGLMIIPCH